MKLANQALRSATGRFAGPAPGSGFVWRFEVQRATQGLITTWLINVLNNILLKGTLSESRSFKDTFVRKQFDDVQFKNVGPGDSPGGLTVLVMCSGRLHFWCLDSPTGKLFTIRVDIHAAPLLDFWIHI